MAEWNDFESRIATASQGSGDISHIPRVKQAGEVLDANGSQWQQMFNGLRLRTNGYYGAWMTELIGRLGGFHEPQEEKVFHAIIDQLEKPQSMIELGSYWGWYSLWFKWRHPSAKVILTEPVRAHLELAAANAANNALDVVLELGGIAPSATAKTEERASSFILPDGTSTPALDVATLMAQHGILNLSILHADIQGAELHMLRQVEALLAARRIEHLFISTHWQKLHEQCREVLLEHGYTFVAEHTPAESYTIDGLLVARSPSLPPLEVAVSRRQT
jgi:FkbM family methyltransferase